MTLRIAARMRALMVDASVVAELLRRDDTSFLASGKQTNIAAKPPAPGRAAKQSGFSIIPPPMAATLRPPNS
jgi:hypothetical protein